MSQSPEPSQNPNQPKTRKKHQGRIHFREAEKLYPLPLIQHAQETMLWLSNLDYLTSSQIAKILFWGEITTKGTPRSLSAAIKAANEMCLRRLKDHGYVEVIPVAEYASPTLLRRHEFNLLTRKGVEALNGQLAAKGSSVTTVYNPALRKSAPLTYDHTLQINNAIANLVGAFRQRGGSVSLCLNDRTLKSLIRAEGQQRTLLNDIEPDALFVIRFPDGVRSYLLEIDTGTEQVRGSATNRFEQKIERYDRYFADRFAHDPLFTGLQKPQVLVVTTGATRAKNLKEATFEAGGRQAYWFSTFEWIDVSKFDPAGKVWLVPTLDEFNPLLPDSLSASP